MSFFDRFRKRKPTNDQLERLARIVNAEQRAALLKAIESGEEIPPYAWEPIPEKFNFAALDRQVHQAREHLRTDVGPAILEAVYKGMSIDHEWSIREPRAFTWWGHRLAQRVSAEPVRNSDGFAVVRLSAETLLLRDVPNTREVAAGLAGINHHASMNALVWDPAQATISLRCVAYAHPDTAKFVEILFTAACGLQASDAYIKVDRLAPLIGGQPATSAHPTSGPRPHPDDMLNIIENFFAPHGNGPSPFSEAHFTAVAQSRALPWLQPEAQGATVRGIVRSQDRPSGTGLLTLSGSSRHPQLGSGLLCVLNIPIEYEPDMQLAVCHELNLAEATTATARCHFFGAWCPAPSPQNGLAFASFVPTASCQPGFLEPLGVSMAARAAWATRVIEAARSEMKTYDPAGRSAAPDNLLNRAIGRTLQWEAGPAIERIRRHFGTGGTIRPPGR
jgi:hypothetical protein